MNRLLAATLLAAALPIAARADDPTSADLQKQINELQRRLSVLEGPAAKPAAPASPSEASASEPFAFADFSWLNGSTREKTPPLETPYFTPELIFDANYVADFNHPRDHTIDGSCETGRSSELQVQQVGVGGDLHYEHVRARLMTQFGMYSQMTPRNDASPARGQWNLADAYRYLSEANAGYHWDAWNGINLDAGIFMSYVGLFSYYNAENWAYQPSYVSANTPWFFNGLRLQTFPSEKLKLEYWLVNGWQSYGMFNETPGVGFQGLWRPTGTLSFVSNDYFGYDTPGAPSRKRFHTDNSVQVKYWDAPSRLLDKAAFSVTVDAGCEDGGGVSCAGAGGRPAQNFLGFMLYNRVWLRRDLFGVTVGGGAITNPGRYLVLLPPVNGATASSGTPHFTQGPGDRFKAWDASLTFDYMPDQYVTWRAEFIHRAANVPYFSGPGGLTPSGGNTGAAGSTVPGFAPDLRGVENRVNLALLVRL